MQENREDEEVNIKKIKNMLRKEDMLLIKC
jgi:ribosomal protein L18E